MRLVLLGPPGGGKGTQATRLAAAFKVPHIATGDLFRFEITQGSELGKLADSYITRGNLVPDSVVNDMMRGRLKEGDCEGFILDGFPRTLEQAHVLEETLEQISRPVEVAVNLVVPDDVIVERAAGRRVCRQCGAVYHLTAKPPKVSGVCDVCSSALTVREDDQPETVRHRLEVYHRSTEPVVEYYQSKGLLLDVDGVGNPNEIFENICAKIQSVCYN